jgi:hypothetical protein
MFNANSETAIYEVTIHMPALTPENTRKFQLVGWILFVVSATFFIGSSFRNGDVLGFVGSLFFLVACLVFLIPMVMGEKVRKKA